MYSHANGVDPLKKWNAAYRQADIGDAEAAQVLRENAHLLPDEGDALDLACGRAGNAVFLAKLAKQNFLVDAVDISPVVLEKLEQYVASQRLNINAHCRDIEREALSDKQYDVIVVSYFLNRQLMPSIITALKPQGLLFYETWSQQKVDDSGPSSDLFRLQTGELLALTKNLRPIFYREESTLGDLGQGTRNVAMLVAQNI